jgi:hypothetical protein
MRFAFIALAQAVGFELPKNPVLSSLQRRGQRLFLPGCTLPGLVRNLTPALRSGPSRTHAHVSRELTGLEEDRYIDAGLGLW